MTDPMSRLAATISERYTIESELGQGGMATVYLAEDIKHHRKVAIKVLHPELSAVLGPDRFLKEIELTANLQHPHILPLFDSGSADGLLFYVMPFVEGETLRGRLQRESQLPVADAVRIAADVADALEYAHKRGVIHRDIKPENILLHDGRPLVADFGIALAVQQAGGARMTQTGMSLGTPQYMAPEQAMGERGVDARADIYALGAVTYEMLTGEAPFTGPTAQAIVAKVMTEKPRSIVSQRETTPVEVEDAVLVALQKLPADRFASAREFAEALRGQGTTRTTRSGGMRAATSPRVRWRDPVFAGVALVALVAVAAAAWLASHRQSSVSAAPVTFVVTAKGVAQPVYTYTWPATVSPDGRTLVYAGQMGNGKYQLYAREVGKLEARPIPGSEEASQAIFSPDSRSVAFQSEGGKLVKIALDDATPTPLADYGQGNGAAWTRRGEIILGASGSYVGLSRVSEGGGTPVPFTHPDTTGGKRFWHIWPVVLPDDRTIVFAIWNSLDETKSGSELAIASLDDGVVHPLGIRAMRPLGMVGNYILYLQPDAVVMATRVDLRGHKALGNPVPVLDSIPMCPICNGDGAVSLSQSGSVVYMRGAPRSHLIWNSKEHGEQNLGPDAGVFLTPRLSPDGSRIAMEVDANAHKDIWIYQIGNGALSPLTTTGDNSNPEWTADGRSVDYRSTRDGTPAIWRQPADFSGEAARIFSDKNVRLWEFSESADRIHLMLMLTPVADLNMEWIALGESVLHPFVRGSFSTWGARFSPSGRSVAYVSTESGRAEVYIRSFPEPGARIQVSTNGGIEPVWSRDGKKLFYAAGNRLMAATLTPEPNISVASQDSLLSGPFFGTILNTASYDVAADGRFLMLKPNDEQFQLVVTLNWGADLAARMGAH